MNQTDFTTGLLVGAFVALGLTSLVDALPKHAPDPMVAALATVQAARAQVDALGAYPLPRVNEHPLLCAHAVRVVAFTRPGAGLPRELGVDADGERCVPRLVEHRLLADAGMDRWTYAGGPTANEAQP